MGLDLTTDVADQRSAHLIELELYEELVEFAEAPDSERIKVLARQIEHSEFEFEPAENGESSPNPEILQVLNEAALAPTANQTSAELAGDPFPDIDTDSVQEARVSSFSFQAAEEGRPHALPPSGPLPVSGPLDLSYLKRPPSLPSDSNGKDKSLSWLGEPAIPVPPSTLAQDAAALGLTVHSSDTPRKSGSTGSLLESQSDRATMEPGSSQRSASAEQQGDSTHAGLSAAQNPRQEGHSQKPSLQTTPGSSTNGNGRVVRHPDPHIAIDSSLSGGTQEGAEQPKTKSPGGKCSECGHGYHPDDLICIGCGAFVG